MPQETNADVDKRIEEIPDHELQAARERYGLGGES